jgi:DNA-binding transcriptional LysR family regulator
MTAASTLPNLLVFCAAYETRSFTQAARRLSLTPQAASRAVARLESSLGTRLFSRSTRTVQPTEAAHGYYASVREALDRLANAEAQLAAQAKVRAGRVRVSVPTSFGHHRLIPSLGAFRERFPQIALDLHIGNRNVDLIREGFDCAIRLGQPREPGWVVRSLGEYPLGIYASPAYLARRGTPQTLDQLAEHETIGFVMPRTGKILPWSLGGRRSSWVPEGALRCHEDVLGLITMARASLGVIQTYDFLVREDVRRGTLTEVLSEHRGSSRAFSLIYPARPRPTPALAAFIAHVRALEAG